MKELKFRVWAGNKMCYPDEQIHKNEKWPHHANDFVISPKGLLLYTITDSYPVARFCGNFSMAAASISFTNPVYQLWTGLKDKNSKDLYEGDIVKTDLKHMASALGLVPNYTKGYIEWLCESWKVCESKIGATHLGDFATCHCCPCGLEIIGNIFENPEFLE